MLFLSEPDAGVSSQTYGSVGSPESDFPSPRVVEIQATCASAGVLPLHSSIPESSFHPPLDFRDFSFLAPSPRPKCPSIPRFGVKFKDLTARQSFSYAAFATEASNNHKTPGRERLAATVHPELNEEAVLVRIWIPLLGWNFLKSCLKKRVGGGGFRENSNPTKHYIKTKEMYVLEVDSSPNRGSRSPLRT